ncbi:hypothetical protein HDU93_007680 [Gonapodya sp. JEL0774]|nr:hypothetical protein HDU93_007680 [Gonapodya sp. JEL0774]
MDVWNPHIPDPSSLPANLPDILAANPAEIAPNFLKVPTFDAREFYDLDTLITLVEKTLAEGNPVVVSHSLEGLHLESVNHDLTLQHLYDHHGNSPLKPRDVLKGEDIGEDWTLKRFLDHLSNPETPDTRLYGKDLDVPAEWQEHIMSQLDPRLRYLGQHDLMGFLPENRRSTNLMLYIGGDGSFTPGHWDLCGSLGQNIMLDADEGAYSLWTVFGTQQCQDAAKLWTDRSYNLHFDNYYLPFEDVKSTPDRSVADVFVFAQRKGDFVFLPSDAAHQVLNVGGRNLKAGFAPTLNRNQL